VTALARWAARAEVPVFAAIGPGRQPAVERLLAGPGLRRAMTPRDAGVLLIAGDMPGGSAEKLSIVHDQIPPPRASLRWREQDAAAIAADLTDLWRDLCAGAAGAPDLQPNEPPTPWRGVGAHGQGGEGMMGGTPYGRPMAMTGPDIRDGLHLDRYTARVGPFAPALPPGMVLDLTLQGDVICEARVAAAPFAQPVAADDPALCAARMLCLLGLPAAAGRVIRGGRAGALWVPGAVPAGLAPVGGQDARDRLRAFLAGETVPVEAARPADLLPDLEWSEAMLALASLPPSTLVHAARAGEPA
jgi:hypothetical protein